MWRKTFDRLRRSIDAADSAANAAYVLYVAKLVATVDQRRQ
jgi:hypothetical protein